MTPVISSSTAGAIIMRIIHGYEAQENNDPFVKLADTAMEQFSLALTPGSHLVDVLPFCNLISSTARSTTLNMSCLCSASCTDLVTRGWLQAKSKGVGCYPSRISRPTLQLCETRIGKSACKMPPVTCLTLHRLQAERQFPLHRASWKIIIPRTNLISSGVQSAYMQVR